MHHIRPRLLSTMEKWELPPTKGEKEATLVANSSGNAPHPCGMSKVKSKSMGYVSTHWENQLYQKGKVEWDYTFGKSEWWKVRYENER